MGHCSMVVELGGRKKVARVVYGMRGYWCRWRAGNGAGAAKEAGSLSTLTN